MKTLTVQAVACDGPAHRSLMDAVHDRAPGAWMQAIGRAFAQWFALARRTPQADRDLARGQPIGRLSQRQLRRSLEGLDAAMLKDVGAPGWLVAEARERECQYTVWREVDRAQSRFG